VDVIIELTKLIFNYCHCAQTLKSPRQPRSHFQVPSSNQIFNASQGWNGTAIRLRVDIGIRANGGDTGEYPCLTSPVLVVALAIIGLLSLTIFGRRVMDSAFRRHRGQGMRHERRSLLPISRRYVRVQRGGDERLSYHYSAYSRYALRSGNSHGNAAVIDGE
jgi:hypothetical protein